MSLLTLLRLNLSRQVIAAAATTSLSSEAIVAAGLFAVATSTTSSSTQTIIASGGDAALVAETGTSTDTNIASGIFSVVAAQTSVSSEAPIAATVTDLASVVDASASSDQASAAPLPAHVFDTSLSSEFIGPVRFSGAGRWSTSGLIRPRPASVDRSPSRSMERLIAAAIMGASVRTDGQSFEEVIGSIVPADFWTLNREVMLAELDGDLLAVAS